MPPEADDNAVDLTSQAAKDAIATEVAKVTAGLKANRDEVLKEKKALADAAKDWEGLDNKAVREMMKNIESSAEAKLISEGKYDEAWDARRAAMQKHFDTELASRDGKIKELTDKEQVSTNRLADLQIGTVLRDAAVKLKVLPAAVDDVLLNGRMAFSMQADGSLAIVNKDGFVTPGADGKASLQPEEWLTNLKETKTHWWAQSTGAGATGGAGGSDNGKTISRDRYDSMGQLERAEFFKGGGQLS